MTNKIAAVLCTVGGGCIGSFIAAYITYKDQIFLVLLLLAVLPTILVHSMVRN